MAQITASRVNTVLLVVLVLVLAAVVFRGWPAEAQNRVIVVVKTVPVVGEVFELEPGWHAVGVSCVMTPTQVSQGKIYELPLCFVASSRAAGK